MANEWFLKVKTHFPLILNGFASRDYIFPKRKVWTEFEAAKLAEIFTFSCAAFGLIFSRTWTMAAAACSTSYADRPRILARLQWWPLFSLYLPAFYHFSFGIKDEKSENFTEADYDFSGVKSEIELQTCEFYEYARESRAVGVEIEAIKKQTEEKKGQINFSSRVTSVIQQQSLIMISLRSESDVPETKLTDKWFWASDEVGVRKQLSCWSKW
jgi:hypothetical protein